MLSRVADNLYWMSRYVERSEHTARLINVNLELVLDRTPHSISRCWERLFASLRLPFNHDIPLDAYNITRILTFEEGNPGSVMSCVAAARENARQVREQLSSEMWEQINGLYLEIKGSNIDQIWWHAQPHQFFRGVKQGTHLFQGISDSTMNHGEGWHFIQLGQYMERVSNIAALLNVYLIESQLTSTDQYMEWVTLLRSCTAFEAYCKVYTAELRYDRIAEFLLLNDEFPHSIHFSIKMMRVALNGIADSTETPKNIRLYRLIGRLEAMLDYDQIDEIIAEGLVGYLHNIQSQCVDINEAIYQNYITYPIEEKLAI